MTPTCLFHLCANQNNKQQQHIADTDLSFSLRPGIWLYLVFPELVLVCTNHQGLSYTHRARRGASSAVPLCSCAVGTLGGLALSILSSSTELWQDNVSPHGRCAARPENLREKKPTVFLSQPYKFKSEILGQSQSPGWGSLCWEWEARPYVGLLWNPNKLCPLNDLTDQLSVIQPNLNGAQNSNKKTLNACHTNWDKFRQHPWAQ